MSQLVLRLRALKRLNSVQLRWHEDAVMVEAYLYALVEAYLYACLPHVGKLCDGCS